MTLRNREKQATPSPKRPFLLPRFLSRGTFPSERFPSPLADPPSPNTSDSTSTRSPTPAPNAHVANLPQSQPPDFLLTYPDDSDSDSAPSANVAREATPPAPGPLRFFQQNAESSTSHDDPAHTDPARDRITAPTPALILHRAHAHLQAQRTHTRTLRARLASELRALLYAALAMETEQEAGVRGDASPVLDGAESVPDPPPADESKPADIPEYPAFDRGFPAPDAVDPLPTTTPPSNSPAPGSLQALLNLAAGTVGRAWVTQCAREVEERVDAGFNGESDEEGSGTNSQNEYDTDSDEQGANNPDNDDDGKADDRHNSEHRSPPPRSPAPDVPASENTPPPPPTTHLALTHIAAPPALWHELDLSLLPPLPESDDESADSVSVTERGVLPSPILASLPSPYALSPNLPVPLHSPPSPPSPLKRPRDASDSDSPPASPGHKRAKTSGSGNDDAKSTSTNYHLRLRSEPHSPPSPGKRRRSTDGDSTSDSEAEVENSVVLKRRRVRFDSASGSGSSSTSSLEEPDPQAIEIPPNDRGKPTLVNKGKAKAKPTYTDPFTWSPPIPLYNDPALQRHTSDTPPPPRYKKRPFGGGSKFAFGGREPVVLFHNGVDQVPKCIAWGRKHWYDELEARWRRGGNTGPVPWERLGESESEGEGGGME